jgi:N-acetyl sugar amidotransferase
MHANSLASMPVGRHMHSTETVYQLCTNCVMDTTDPKNVFDERGVCRHCNNYYNNILPHWHTDELGMQELQPVVDRIKADGKGKEFDCILGMSGGLDSSYLTYVAKEILGLRPLVFHVDAGWNSQTAVNNIEKLVEGMGLTLFTEVINWDEMRDLQLAFFKSGVAHLDTPQDHAFYATMYNFAAKYKIRTILNGGNYSTECVENPLEWHYHASDLRQLKDIHRRYGTRPLTTFPMSNILRYKLYYRYVKGITVVRPLNFVPYKQEEAKALLKAKFGWQEYPHKHYESRFTKFYEGFWKPKKFGIDCRKAQFSSLILTGQMTRAEALEKLSRPAWDEETIKSEFGYIATKLGITVGELQSYLEGPNRSYRDFKNQEWFINLGTRAMIGLGMTRSLVR